MSGKVTNKKLVNLKLYSLLGQKINKQTKVTKIQLKITNHHWHLLSITMTDQSEKQHTMPVFLILHSILEN
jgi:hypothetical protein